MELTALEVAAAAAGQLAMLRFLHEKRGKVLPKSVFLWGASLRSLSTMRWLLQAGCPMDPLAYGRAASVGNAAMVQWKAGAGGGAPLECVPFL